MRMLMRAILFASLLGGCTITRAINTCPPVVEYSAETQARAADELDALPDGSVLAQMIVDYGQERAALRACRK